MNARAENTAQRGAIYASLRARNRFIAVLRIALPVLGALVFSVFVAQIVIASFVSNFGIGKVSFNGDTVKVDTPSYSGIMADGDVYKVSAEAAETGIKSFNIIELRNALLELTKPDGTRMTARAGAASFETLGQIVTVPGVTEVGDSKGDSGTLARVVVDLAQQTVKATGKVNLSLAGGATVESDGLSYDPKTGIWDFNKATLTVPDTDDEGKSAP